VHSGSFAPAFTLSFHDSERSRKPPNAHSLGRYGLYIKKKKMRHLSTILFLVLILTACTQKKQNDSDKINGFEPFTSKYIEEIRRNHELQLGGPKLSWEYRCGDINELESFSLDTLELLRKYHKIADSIITDNDIYDLLGQTIFPTTTKSLPDSDKTLIQQVTFTNIDLDFKTLTEEYKEFIDKSDLLFLFSQMTSRPYYWNEKKMYNVKCISTKELKEVFYIPDKTPLDSIKKVLKRCRKKMEAKYGHNYFDVYSKPLFNRDKTFAVMTLQFSNGGFIMFFRKENNKWTLIKREGTWTY
jgi:hypothetical protein